MANGQYVGGELGWFSPFAVLCGFGLCLGYALLGAAWLVQKCEGDLREAALPADLSSRRRRLVFLVVVFVYALAEKSSRSVAAIGSRRSVPFPSFQYRCCRGERAGRKLAPPLGWPGPLHGRHHLSRGLWTLAISFWPYMIPFAITIDEAKAPASRPGIHVLGRRPLVFPLMLIYTVISYSVFRGKSIPRPGITRPAHRKTHPCTSPPDRSRNRSRNRFQDASQSLADPRREKTQAAAPAQWLVVPPSTRRSPIYCFRIAGLASPASTDTIGFLAFGGLFTAHITGNFVVLAAHIVSHHEGVRSGGGLSVPVFCCTHLADPMAGGHG